MRAHDQRVSLRRQEHAECVPVEQLDHEHHRPGDDHAEEDACACGRVHAVPFLCAHVLGRHGGHAHADGEGGHLDVHPDLQCGAVCRCGVDSEAIHESDHQHAADGHHQHLG